MLVDVEAVLLVVALVGIFALIFASGTSETRAKNDLQIVDGHVERAGQTAEKVVLRHQT